VLSIIEENFLSFLRNSFVPSPLITKDDPEAGIAKSLLKTLQQKLVEPQHEPLN
jgi:hypothetical protein